jgi:hypothetical protein
MLHQTKIIINNRMALTMLALAALLLPACRLAPATPAAVPTPAVKLSGPVSVTSARMLTDVVAEKEPLLAALSPDGAYIAYYKDVGSGSDRKGQICVYTFSNAAKSCSDLTRDRFAGYPYQLQWSPDSSMITFTENPAELGNESDIWLFRVSDGSFTNLTDDGITQGWRDAQRLDPGKQIMLDYLPAWNAADGMIYFWRGTPIEYLKFNMGLHRIAPAGGEPELVRDLTTAIPSSLPVFKQENFYLDGPSAISPDGRNAAALMSTLNEFGGMETSLWLIDLTDANIAPRELITPGGFNAGLPAWQEFPAYPYGVSWAADSKDIVAHTRSDDSHTPITVFYHVDAATGVVTPAVDFSGVADTDAYSAPAPNSDLPMRYFSAQTGSISPVGDKLLMLSDLAGVVGVLTSLLPPAEPLPYVSGLAEATLMSSSTRASHSKDGKVLMYGLLLTVTE